MKLLFAFMWSNELSAQAAQPTPGKYFDLRQYVTCFNVNFMFHIGGGYPEAKRASELSQLLSINVSSSQVYWKEFWFISLNNWKDWLGVRT